MIRKIRPVEIKHLYMNFLLHINDDFDDDLLSDALTLLDWSLTKYYYVNLKTIVIFTKIDWWGSLFRSLLASESGPLSHNTRCNSHKASFHSYSHSNTPNRILKYKCCMTCVYKLLYARLSHCMLDKLWTEELCILSKCHHLFCHRVWRSCSKVIL